MLRQRAYYYCQACHAGHAPIDPALGLSASELTPGAEQVAALAGATDPFGVAAERILPKLSGLRLAESTVERAAEAAGSRLGERLVRGDTFGPATIWPWHHDADGKACAYLSIDATGVGIQGPGGSRSEGRMAYVATVFNPIAPALADPRGPRPPRPEAVSHARYLAGFHDLDGLGEQLARQGRQVGLGRADRVIALTDGGNGLEDWVRLHFPTAELILDFWHAAGHLAEAARELRPGDAAGARELTEEWCHQMKQEGGEATLARLAGYDLSDLGAEALEVHRRVRQYLAKNVHRMDYPRYRRNGWQIGSGTVESACKTVVGKRLKGGGMRWGSDGANAVCHLRALLLGEKGQWDAFWTQGIN